MSSRKIIYLAMTFLLITAAGSALRIHTLETDQTEYGPGDDVTIEGFIINDEETPIADHEVELAIAYSPIYNPERATDGETIRYREYIPLEMKSEETNYINHTWNVPEDAQPGSYKVYFRILNPNEDLQVFNTHRFNVTDEGQKVRAASVGELFFHQATESGVAIGYSLEGLRVTPDREANATLEVANVGNTDLDLNVSMDMQYTYDSTQSAFQMYEQQTIEAGETDTVVFEFMPPNDPTTYTPIFRIHDSQGTFLGETNGRLVVRGNSGRILRAGIDDNAYASGDTISITADLIGPADYSGTIEDATFNYSITTSEGIVAEGEEQIDIGGQVTEMDLETEAGRSFANPNVTMVLSKDGNVYDRYTASYTGGTAPSSDTPFRLIAGIIIVVLAAGLLVWRWKE